MRSPEEEALISAISDDLAAGIWVATAPEGRFVYANRAFDEIMGMGPVPESAVGAYAVPYGIFGRDGKPYPEHKLPFVRALVAAALVVVDDIVIHRRDGRRVYVRAFGKPMRDAIGTITHIAIVFFDITREVESERARVKAEEQLSDVVAHAPVVLFAFDRRGIFTVSQGRALEVLGAKPHEAIGHSVFERFAEVPEIARHARRALAGESVVYTVEVRATVFETWLTPRRDEAGEIVGAIGVSTDVTDRYRIGARLAQAERLASVGMLAAGVAHEINNPMSYVIGNLDLVRRELARPAPDIKALEQMVRDARDGAAERGRRPPRARERDRSRAQRDPSPCRARHPPRLRTPGVGRRGAARAALREPPRERGPGDRRGAGGGK